MEVRLGADEGVVLGTAPGELQVPVGQQLLVFSERFGRQIEVPLMVRDREHEAKAGAGDWDPLFGRGLLDDLQVGGAVGTMPLVR